MTSSVAVEDAQLKARRFTPGVGGEVIQLRLELRSAIDRTFAALEARRAEDPSLAEAAAWVARRG